MTPLFQMKHNLKSAHTAQNDADQGIGEGTDNNVSVWKAQSQKTGRNQKYGQEKVKKYMVLSLFV